MCQAGQKKTDFAQALCWLWMVLGNAPRIWREPVIRIYRLRIGQEEQHVQQAKCLVQQELQRVDRLFPWCCDDYGWKHKCGFMKCSFPCHITWCKRTTREEAAKECCIQRKYSNVNHMLGTLCLKKNNHHGKQYAHLHGSVESAEGSLDRTKSSKSHAWRWNRRSPCPNCRRRASTPPNIQM